MNEEDLLEAIRQQLAAMMGKNSGLAIPDKDGVVRITISVNAPLEYSADLINNIVEDMRNDIDTRVWLQQSWDMPAYEKPTK